MSETKTFLSALHALQSEAPKLPKDKTNPHFNSKFTGLDTIVETIGPLLTRHGLVWITKPSQSDHGPTLEYRLVHVESGEGEQGTMPLLLTKTDSQGLGSALTYARRYALCSVLNLVSDDDDDGNASSAPVSSRPGSPGRTSEGVTASPKQIQTLNKLIKQKAATFNQVEAILKQSGFDFEMSVDWRDKLTGGGKGSASALIGWLMERPLPDTENPSDVPGYGSEDFKVPPAGGDDVPFDTQETAA